MPSVQRGQRPRVVAQIPLTLVPRRQPHQAVLGGAEQEMVPQWSRRQHGLVIVAGAVGDIHPTAARGGLAGGLNTGPPEVRLPCPPLALVVALPRGRRLADLELLVSQPQDLP